MAWRYSYGPCEAQDLVGLDVVLAARLGSTPPPMLGRMVVEGRKGKANGLGYYRYLDGGAGVAYPLINDLIRQEAKFYGRVRDELKCVEVVDRLYSLVGPALRSDPEGAVALLSMPESKLGRL